MSESKSEIGLDKKLHIYIRVSSDIQSKEGNSLDTQSKLGIDKFNQLKRDGLVDDYEIYDEGVFSSKDESIEGRKKLKLLMKRCERGLVKHLFVQDPDRLSRNSSSWEFIRSILKKKSVILYTPYQIINLKSKYDNFIMGFMKEYSVLNNEDRREKSVLGKINSVREGKWKGGKVNFGYRSNPKTKILEIDEFESKWVKRIFNLYDEGKSVLEIKNELEINGIMIDYGKLKRDWNLNSIRNILTNTIYRGYWFFSVKEEGEVVEKIKVKSPTIISRELFERVSKKVKRNERKLQNNSTKHFYLLRSLMECSCGRIIKGRKKIGKSKEGKNIDEGFYYCDNRMEVWREGKISENEKYKRGLFCSNQKSMNIKKTDNLVWMVLLNVVSKSVQLKENYKKELVSKIKGIRDEGKDNKRKFDIRIKKLEKEEERIKKLLTSITINKLDGEIEGDMDKVIDHYNSKKVEIEEKIKEENKLFNNLIVERKWVNWLEKFNEELMNKDGLKESDKKDYIEKLVDKILVSFNPSTKTHNLQFKFKLPIINDMRVKEEGKYVIKDGNDILDLDGVELYGRVYKMEDEKKKIEEIIVKSIPTKQTQSVTVE